MIRSILASFVLLAAQQTVHAQAGIITTVAGGGSLTGTAANGAQGTSLKITGSPLSVAADSSGNVYVLDGGGGINRLYKVNPAGVVTLVAGGGNGGDGGPAASAQIFATGVAVDSAGNIYLAGNALRKINTSGIISTLAQVVASNAAVDGAGNLYMPTLLTNRIVKVDPAGNVTNFAGNGTSGNSGDGGPAIDAALFLPQGIAADAAGNVYFADNGAYVRKVDTQGIITRVAGSGSPLSFGDGGPATSAGMTPVFVAVDKDGNLYIADTGGGRIRKVNTSGIITTVAGGGLHTDTTLGDGGPATSAYLGGPRSVAVDGLGNIFIGDDNNFRVRKVSSGAAGSPVSVTPTALSFSVNAGAAAPPSQTVVITSPGATLTFTATATTTRGGGWLSVSPASGNVNATLTISVNPAGLDPGSYTGTISIQPSGAGNPAQTVPVQLTVNAPASQAIITTVAGNGNVPYSGDGGAATGTALAANAIALDSSGNLYVADIVSSRVLKVSASGTVTTLAGNGATTFSGDGGPGTKAALFSPSGVAADSSGNVYIADSSNNRVRKVDAGGTINTVAGSATPGFSGDGGPATNAALFSPIAVAVDNNGNLYIADSGNGRVRKVNAAGTISTIASSLILPGGLAVDSGGNVYVAEIGLNRIRKITAAGAISTVAGNSTKGFSGDGGAATSAALNLSSAHAGLAVDSSGNLYIADTGNQRIRKVTPDGIISTVAGNGVAGFSGDNGPATNAGLNNPTDVALDSGGNLFIADTTNNRVRKVSNGGSTGAAPAVSSNGIVNGASFQPGIVPNSWGTLLGSNLSPVTDTWANAIVNGKLPTSLDGVSVSVGGKPAYIYFVSAGQINFIVPDVPSGSTQVTVTTPSGTSSSYTATAAQFGPAFFASWPNSQVVATRQDFSFAAAAGSFPGVDTTPAHPGDILILWGTGFGPTSPAAPTGVQVPGTQTYSTQTMPTVTINGIPATVYGAALAPGFAGLYQVAIQVPPSLAAGTWPVVATIGGVSAPPASLVVK
ncbi:MAG TPA: SBBP repeat-containing protein [Candidatus Limnocylindrales bacterium]|nr:SBBP repeat-containing protein [Candidatus Limnocylindrales bacterium]